MKPFFTEDDFYLLNGFSEKRDAAKLANAKLQTWLDTAPMVYGLVDGNWDCWKTLAIEGNSHTARLVDIRKVR